MDCPGAPSCGGQLKCSICSVLQPLSVTCCSTPVLWLDLPFSLFLAEMPSHFSILSHCASACMSRTVLARSQWPLSQIFRWSISTPLKNCLTTSRHKEIDEMSSNARENSNINRFIGRLQGGVLAEDECWYKEVGARGVGKTGGGLMQMYAQPLSSYAYAYG